MQRHTQDDLIAFLRAVDRFLEQRYPLVIIGGAAASLAYDDRAARTTTDVDSANPLSEEFQQAMRRAAEATGLNVPIEYHGVYDGPYEWEQRLYRPEHLQFPKIKISIPERHDLALMKVIRGEEHDIQTVLDMHKDQALDLQVLMQRFQSEMAHVTGNMAMIRLNFIGLVEALFGEEPATRADEQTQNWGKHQT